MPVKNLCLADVAICELMRGESLAPPEILEQLRVRGYVDGAKRLTLKGRKRGEALKGREEDLRRMFGRGGNTMLRTVGSGGMIYLSGPVRIRS
jgi:hypothetical protein